VQQFGSDSVNATRQRDARARRLQQRRQQRAHAAMHSALAAGYVIGDRINHNDDARTTTLI
jgi:hypothetical protein